MAADQEKKIISDDSWKEEARQAKEKLKQDKAAAAGYPAADAGAAPGKDNAGAAPQQMPPANILTLINSLAIQALYCMGGLGTPEGEQPTVNLDLAKHHIDMLSVLEEKTKGNLTDEEAGTLTMALHELRMRYVSLCQAAG